MKSLLVVILSSALLGVISQQFTTTAAAALRAPAATPTPCGCSNVSLCQPLPHRAPVEQEIMGYCLNKPDHAPLYNWSLLTTMAYYGADAATGEPLDWTTYCLAKQHGVKFALAQGNSPNLAQLKKETLWKQAIDAMVSKVVNNGYDGLHFDWELYSGLNPQTRISLSAAVTYLSTHLKSRGLQFTAAVEVYPDDTLHALAVETDFLMIMDYDRAGPHPGPNARYAGAVRAIDAYGAYFSNVSHDFKKKLVLGLPWYGHYYGCTNDYNVSHGIDENKCEGGQDLGEIPYSVWSRVARGQHNGTFSYHWSLLAHQVNLSVGFARLDYTPLVSHSKHAYKWVTAYYDTPATLKLKYAMAGRKGIRGVSMWTIDFVSYALDDPHGAQERAEMWDAVDAFLHPSARRGGSIMIQEEEEKR